jgi:hypothetical protein
MELSTEVIQERILEDFQLQLCDFHNQCENDYLDEFRGRIINGNIDPNDTEYRAVCYNEAKKYKDKIYSKTLVFVREYINNSFDLIDDLLREGVLTKEEAAAAFITLKHILIAAEINKLPV